MCCSYRYALEERPPDPKCYAMRCFGTYFTHAQTCDNVRVQSATQCAASVHTLHMPKPVITVAFKVHAMHCCGAYFTHFWMAARKRLSRYHVCCFTPFSDSTHVLKKQVRFSSLAFFRATFSLVFAIDSAMVERSCGGGNLSARLFILQTRGTAFHSVAQIGFRVLLGLRLRCRLASWPGWFSNRDPGAGEETTLVMLNSWDLQKFQKNPPETKWADLQHFFFGGQFG